MLKFLGDLGKWILAVSTAWHGWLPSSSVAAFIGIGQSLGWWQTQRRTYAYIFALGIAYSFFESWRTEHRKAEEAEARVYDGRAVIVVKVTGQPAQEGPRYRAPSFSMQNVGDRAARFVRMDTIRSRCDKYTMSFTQVTVLKPNEEHHFSFFVNNSHALNDGELAWKFFHDNPEGAALVWYDPLVHFRDTADAAMQDRVRLAYDIRTGVLYFTGVPYTLRPPEKYISLLPAEETRLSRLRKFLPFRKSTPLD